jgi:hypothetical protein
MEQVAGDAGIRFNYTPERSILPEREFYQMSYRNMDGIWPTGLAIILPIKGFR